MIPVLQVSCFHVFFVRCKVVFFGSIFIVNTGGNQQSFCDVLIKNFGSYMTENYFKICRKSNDKFFNKFYIICFVSKEYGFLDVYRYIYAFNLSYIEEESPV